MAIAKAVLMLASSVSLKFLVSEDSGFDVSSPLPSLLLMVVLVVAISFGRRWARGRPGVPMGSLLEWRLLTLLLTPTLGFLSLAVFLTMQINELGAASYYFLKYLLGFGLVLACVAPPVVASLIPVDWTRGMSTRRALPVALITSVLGSQLLAPATEHHALLFSATDDGTAAINPPYTREGIARGVLDATGDLDPARSLEREYVALGAGNALQIFYPDAWYHAINGTVTNKAMERMNVLRVRADDVDLAVPLIRRLLETNERVTVAVPSAFVRGVQDSLAPELAARVTPVEGVVPQR
jgi:hypothetical protein